MFQHVKFFKTIVKEIFKKLINVRLQFLNSYKLLSLFRYDWSSPYPLWSTFVGGNLHS